MKCLSFEENIEIEDWMDGGVSGCPHSGIIHRRMTGEGGYCAVDDRHWVLYG